MSSSPGPFFDIYYERYIKMRFSNLFIYLISNSYSSTQEKKKKKKRKKNNKGKHTHTEITIKPE